MGDCSLASAVKGNKVWDVCWEVIVTQRHHCPCISEDRYPT